MDANNGLGFRVVRMVYVVGHIQPAPDALNWVGDVHMTLSVFGMS